MRFQLRFLLWLLVLLSPLAVHAQTSPLPPTYTWNGQTFYSLQDALDALKAYNGSVGQDLKLCDGFPSTTILPGQTLYRYCLDRKEASGPMRGGFYASHLYLNSWFGCDATATPANPNLLNQPHPPCHVGSEQELYGKFKDWYYQAYAGQCNLEDPTTVGGYTLPVGHWSDAQNDGQGGTYTETYENDGGLSSGRAFQIRWKVRISPTQCDTVQQEQKIVIQRQFAYRCPAGYQIRNQPEVPLGEWPKICKATPLLTDIVLNGPPPANSCPSAGNPCIPGTGEKLLLESDFEWSGHAFGRSYRSLGHFESKTLLGNRWWHSWSARLNILSGSSQVYRYSPRGDYEQFNLVSGTSNQYSPLYSSGRYMEKQADNSWILVDENGPDELYSATGRLTGIRDDAEPARSLAFGYDSKGRLSTVTTGLGRTLTLVYQNGFYADPVQATGWVPDRLIRIQTDLGVQLAAYGYDSANRLTTVQHADGTVRTYVYGETDHLCGGGAGGCNPATFAQYVTGIVDENNTRFSDYHYDPYGRVLRSVHAGGANDTTLTYSGTNQTVVTQAGRPTLTYNFDTSMYRRATTVQAADGSITTQFDTLGAWKQVTDKRGTVTRTEYDNRRRVTNVIEAQGLAEQRSTSTAGYGTLIRTVDNKNAAGTTLRRTIMTYNTRQQVIQQDVIDMTVTPNVTRTTLYAYCEQSDVTAGACPYVGLLKSVDGPRSGTGDTTTYAYYTSDAPGCIPGVNPCLYRKGDLQSVTRLAGQTTDILEYDDGGRPLAMQDENDVVVQFEYDARGRMTARKVRGTDGAVETDDQITRIEYWPSGEVKKVTQPDGAFTSYTYDNARRLTGIADNAGNSMSFTLNGAGERTLEQTRDPQNALLRTLSRTYNTLGQLQTVTDAYGRNTGFTYDANGNPDQTTDALSRVTDNNHDPLDRLSRVLQDMNDVAAETKFSYDALDNLTQVNDPKGLNTNYSYNGFGDVTQLQSPDTGTTTYTYDSAGNRVSQTDARSKVTNYAYDNLNRLTGITYPAATALNTTLVYDTAQADCLAGETFTKGRLTRMVDGSGSTNYCYDRFGNLVRKVQTTNNKKLELRYVYAVNGQLERMIYPDGAEVEYLYDAQGRVREIKAKTLTGTQQTLITGVNYYPFGPAASWRYGSSTGRLLNRTLNQNYQPGVVQDTAAGGLSVGYEFDEVGNLKRLRDGNQSEPPQRVYGYDGLNRLTETRNGSTNALLEGYAYDKTGNRTSATIGATTTAYSYPTTSHRLTAVGTAAVRVYDAAGNTTSVPGTVTKNYVYGDHGRMTQTKDGSTVRMNYVYNGRGEQVRKYLSTTNTYTVYDEAGHWVGDYGNNGSTAPSQQAIWFGDMPVGLFVGAGASQKLHYIQPDALGAPRVVIDPTRGAQGTTIWRWDLTGEAFGTTAPNQNPDGDATNFVFNMRFPGQRYDSASGLNYNYFRDYEAATGRYVESDPIGMSGGVSTYGYVGGNPVRLADFFGLCAKKCSDTPDRAPHHLVVKAVRPMGSSWLSDLLGMSSNPGTMIVTYEIQDRSNRPVLGIHYWQERLSRPVRQSSTSSWHRLTFSSVDDVHDFYSPEEARMNGVENSLQSVDQWFLIKDEMGCIVRLTTVMRTTFQFRNGVQTDHKTFPVVP